MKEQVKYSFRGMSLPVSAAKIGPYLEEIAKENDNKLNAKIVLNKAKDPKDLLHPCFDWDNKVAAEKWRLEQARSLISAIVITYKNGNEEVESKAFVNIIHDEYGQLSHNSFDRRKGTSYFVTVNDALSSTALKAYTLDQALIEMDNFQRKYSHLIELADIFKKLKVIKAKSKMTKKVVKKVVKKLTKKK